MSDRKDKVPHDLNYMWNLKNIIDAEDRLVIGRGEVKVVGKMGEGGQKV